MLKKGTVARVVTSTALAAVMAGLPAVQALACTQITVGPELTSNGDTYFGRSEDYANRYGKCFGIEPATTEGKLIQSYENGEDPTASFSYQITRPTFRYTYVRDTPDNWTHDYDPAAKAYSEAGTNEKGVSVSSTLTTDMNGKIRTVDDTVATGIGEYSIADFVLSQASTAREGVELLGAVIDEKGSQDCNQILIGDATETWVFMQLSGHQWCAVKAPADMVSVNPNMDNLQFDVDINDPDSCIHSEGLVSKAEEAGSDVVTEGRFNVAASYGGTSEAQGGSCNIRYVQGHKYFGDEALGSYVVDEARGVTSIENNRLFFSPTNTQIDTFTALRALAARGEGTDVDANVNPFFYAIGTNRNTESHMFQVRDEYAADDPEIATLQWEGLSRSEFSVFVPSYSNLLTEVDQDIYPLEHEFDITHVGIQSERNDPEKIANNEKVAMADGEEVTLDSTLMDLNTLCYNHRDTVATGARAYLDVVQKDLISEQAAIDEVMAATPGTATRTKLANRAHAVASRATFEKCHALLEEVRAYLRAGDFSTPFAASDLSEEGTLVEPLGYDHAFELAIDRQPASTTAFAGEPTTALSVSVKGATDGATYVWQMSTDGEKWVDCGTNNTYVPQTSEVGATSYRVVVTNELGYSVTSDAAVVTVSEKPEPLETGTMYRLYNPYTGEHFYTASFDEMMANVQLGWLYEGSGWTAPSFSNTPVYRVYNPYAGDHHYTTSEVERDHLVSLGWSDEGIGWYSDDAEGVPLYRQYNPNAQAGAHNYTTSGFERDTLVSLGWSDEGIAWYGVATKA